MPEWPEMEHYKRMLNKTVAGQFITGAEVEREKSLNVPVMDFQRRVIHNQIVNVTRRAKMILFHLHSGDTLLLHLMLGGWIRYGKEIDKPDRTIQVTLHFGEYRLYFIGLRLGYLHMYDQQQLDQRFAELGPDPFDPHLNRTEFNRIIMRKRTPLKVLLTDQSVLSGIGNCYSDEICFEARLRPARKPDSLSEEEQQALYDSMHAVLREALDYGGYMDQPFMPGDRITGGYDSRCKVYDREGEPCYRCGGSIVREEITSKKTFYCAECQR